MEGETPPLSHVHAEQDEESVSLLNPNNTIEIETENEQMEDLSSHARTSSNISDNLDRALTSSLLNRLNPANFMDDSTGSRAMVDVLTHRCINFAIELQKLIRHYGPAFSKLRKDVLAWIRANPWKYIGMLGGTTLFALALATPAILGAIGFSAIGPVAGSIAAGWQATMGSVAAGSLFAFLQSAAMGGAAMGIFVGIGALGGAIAVGLGFASLNLKGIIGGLMEKFKGPTVALVENFKGAMNGLVENFKGAMSGLAENFMGLFGKTKDN